MIATNFEYGRRRQANQGITAPFFTAFDGFKQIGVRPACQFEITGERSFKVCENFSHYRDSVVLLASQVGELFRCHGLSLILKLLKK